MIRQSEIRKIAEKEKTLASIIDKDWVLGHILAGLFTEKTINKHLIFKGGTCLRKCYYSNYRFSEDLDFTWINPSFNMEENHIRKILKTISDQIDIPFFIKTFKNVKSDGIHVGWDADIRYWGANHKKHEQPTDPKVWVDKIKLEIRHYELMINQPVEKLLIHNYSDNDLISNVKILCYPIEEILAEKFRSLLQRRYQAPRDYYDIWFLSKNEKNINWVKITDSFYKKSKFKNIQTSELKTFLEDTKIHKICKEWNNSLANQIPSNALPSCENVIRHTKNLIEDHF